MGSGDLGRCRVFPIGIVAGGLFWSSMAPTFKIIFASAVAGALLLVAAGQSQAQAQTKPSKERKTMKTATGTFDVKMLPPSAPAAGESDGFVRLSLDKTFQGALHGASRG